MDHIVFYFLLLLFSFSDSRLSPFVKTELLNKEVNSEKGKIAVRNILIFFLVSWKRSEFKCLKNIYLVQNSGKNDFASCRLYIFPI